MNFTLLDCEKPIYQYEYVNDRVTSALTVAEASRAVLRARLSGRITARQEQKAILTLQRFARRCYIVSVTITTRDLRVRDNAIALNHPVE